jgi:hypothetical protein
MASGLAFKDYISPLICILRGENTDRRRQVESFLRQTGRLFFKHTHHNYAIAKAAEKIVDPAWLRSLRRFRPAEWQRLAGYIHQKAGGILGRLPAPEIILYPGLKGSNGRVYKYGGRIIIALSPDFGLSGAAYLKGLMAHEYAHFIRRRLIRGLKDNDTIGRRLYEEGWAIYLTTLLFPRMPLSMVLMCNLHAGVGLPDPRGGYLRWCHGNIGKLCEEMSRVVGSYSRAQQTRFFDCGRFGSKKTPIRTGYFLGYVLLLHLAELKKLPQLLKLKPTSGELRRWLKEISVRQGKSCTR